MLCQDKYSVLCYEKQGRQDGLLFCFSPRELEMYISLIYFLNVHLLAGGAYGEPY